MPWRGPEEPGEYPTLGWLAMDWIEENLLLTDGPKMGQPFSFYDEQAEHLLQRYRVDPEADEDWGNDAFQFGGSMWVRGQKWGKDPAMAALNLFHAFGPCDFAGWDADGNPVGRPHPSPWIFVAALNDDQANNTWLPMKQMVEASVLVDLPGVEVTKDQILLPSGNPMERLTTTAWGRLGGRFTGGSLTENGLMTATGDVGNGNRSPLKFANTLIRSVDGMGGMWIAATNPWDPTEYSHAQRVYEAKNPHIYVDAKLSRQKVDLTDTEAVERELIYLYGDSLKERGGHQSVKRLTRSVQDESKPEAERRRFFMGEILVGEMDLCSTTTWAAQDRTDPNHPDAGLGPLRAGQAVTVGFDGSRSRDRTVLDVVRIADCRIFPVATWVPRCMCVRPKHKPEQCRDRKIPRLEVDQKVDEIFAAYEVWYLLGDPYKFQESMELWLAKHGKPLKQQPKSTSRVLEVPTNVETRMDSMIERFTTLRDARGFTFSDPEGVLTQHVADTAIAKGRRKPSKPRMDSEGRVLEHYLKLAKKRDGVYIDHSVGMLLGLEGRGLAIEDGALSQKPKNAIAPQAYRDTDSAGTRTSRSRRGRRSSQTDGPDWDNVRF